MSRVTRASSRRQAVAAKSNLCLADELIAQICSEAAQLDAADHVFAWPVYRDEVASLFRPYFGRQPDGGAFLRTLTESRDPEELLRVCTALRDGQNKLSRHQEALIEDWAELKANRVKHWERIGALRLVSHRVNAVCAPLFWHRLRLCRDVNEPATQEYIERSM